MNKISSDLVVVLGPTATGKTSLAVQIAEKVNGEIISADSRQVYRDMDLGTGKDLADYTLNGKVIPHHLIDIVDAGSKYNVYEYQTDFLKAYSQLKADNKTSILCGGTGMYIEAVLKGYKLISVPVDEALRADLLTLTLEELRERLTNLKQLHNTSDIDTKKRAIRAIEIETYYLDHPKVEIDYPVIRPTIFGVKLEREEVKSRITLRLKERLRAGMIDEVQALMDSGVPAENLLYYGLEYKFITQFLLNEFSYNKMVEKLNVAIHQFSRRQMTWFRRMERNGFLIHWVDGMLPMEDKVSYCMDILNKKPLV